MNLNSHISILSMLVLALSCNAQDSLNTNWIKKLNIASVAEYHVDRSDEGASDTNLISIQHFNKYHKLTSEIKYSDTESIELIYGLKFDTITIQKKGYYQPAGKLFQYEMYDYDKKGRLISTFKYYKKRRVRVQNFKYNRKGQLNETILYHKRPK